MKVGFTATQFKSALSGLSYINSYNPVVTRITYDASGAVTTGTADIAFYEYNITIVRIRPESDPKLPACSIKTGIIVATNQTHSPGLDGIFQIKYNGSTLTSVPPSINIYNLHYGFATATGSPDVVIYPRATYQFPDQLDFDVIFYGVSAIPEILIETAALTGGADNAITASVTTRRALAYDRPFFPTIPMDFMYTAEALPSLQLTLNSIPVICSGCFYSVLDTSPVTVSAVTINAANTGLDIVLANPGSLVFAISDLSITLFGEPCTISASATDVLDFECLFNTNADGSIKIPGGVGLPQIHIRQLGYLELTGISSLTFTISVTSLTPS